MPREHASGSGQRDRLVMIQQSTEGVSTSRYPTEAPWTDLAAVWARMMPMSGSERFAADQTASKAELRWEIPYFEGMDPALVDVPKTRRIVYQSKVYDITYAAELGRREGIEVETESGELLQ